MDPSSVFPLFSLFLSFFFLVSLLVHLLLHFHDGLNIVRDITYRTRTIKITLCLIQAISNLVMFAWQMERYYMVVITAVWVESAVLVVFDYRRWLKASWTGQRGFWIIALAINSGNLSTIFASESDPPSLAELFFTLAMVASSGVLAGYSILKPNDYLLMSQNQQMMETLLKDPQEYSKKSSMSLVESQLSVSLSTCKVKRLKTNTQLDYRFAVSVNGSLHQLKISSFDLEDLDQRMRAKFSPEAYPYLDFPRLPKAQTAVVDLDEHAKKIEVYIDRFCQPEYRCEELFEFLRVQRKDRDRLETPMVKFIDMYESVSLSSRTSSDSNLQILPNVDEAAVTYFFCKIEGWSKVEHPVPHIVYHVHWSALSYPYSGTVSKRFSDFYKLHRAIKAIIGKAKPPEFPSKNYFRSLIGELDNRALDLRKRALERYICYVLNDPAFCCTPLLSFLGFSLPLEALWSKSPPSPSISLLPPLTWFSELDSDGSLYHCYSLTFEQDDSRWVAIRRYSEFDQLNTALANREGSKVLQTYLVFSRENGSDCSGGVGGVGGIGWVCESMHLPQLPSKTLNAIGSIEELEERRLGLEKYLMALIEVPGVRDSYAFRIFAKGRVERILNCGGMDGGGPTQ